MILLNLESHTEAKYQCELRNGYETENKVRINGQVKNLAADALRFYVVTGII